MLRVLWGPMHARMPESPLINFALGQPRDVVDSYVSSLLLNSSQATTNMTQILTPNSEFLYSCLDFDPFDSPPSLGCGEKEHEDVFAHAFSTFNNVKARIDPAEQHGRTNDALLPVPSQTPTDNLPSHEDVFPYDYSSFDDKYADTLPIEDSGGKDVTSPIGTTSQESSILSELDRNFQDQSTCSESPTSVLAIISDSQYDLEIQSHQPTIEDIREVYGSHAGTQVQQPDLRLSGSIVAGATHMSYLSSQ